MRLSASPTRWTKLCRYDLVVVTLLAHQVDAVLLALKRRAVRYILFMFNNFDPERLRDTIGIERRAMAPASL
ncbi:MULTISPECIES: hypothetical protein [unclassified Rhizobium]|uniref:hypothetical protein n=1 Tax=unclassified Rhizobium TaxID=2613769 RepID=UPI0006978164|nr:MULTISPECIES: hypothetical protein [unclassified Rhizobium]